MNPQAIKKFRLSLRLTQKEFARTLGVSRAAVAKWEAGDCKPSPLATREIERLKARSKRH